ncbi:MULTISPECIES: DUF4150 domain-containing protein [Pseudomonas]|uniref:Type IV secretion protein Rhs n=2 Tax=Pseudomonas TaxID=286 RepID=A0A0R3AUP8_9PSED|nr:MULTISPECIES: DUF4150 domain-containing protein [Pseudomonas]KRP74083.1 type IV secretion protein Rhs [Pseudomonas paralactis]MBJ2217607.1 DUF4150 domain-containing protein [Pseudomonas sp. MF7453]MDY4298820.1 DUF4150 domain-containing protein [Pseudomonas salmasensis]
MADNVIARRQDKWKVVSIVPDVCKTPMGSAIPPVPYPVTAELKTATGVARSVRVNGEPVVVFNKSLVPSTKGDGAGAAKGIKSNTVGGKCYPLEKSSTVKAEGKLMVRNGDLFWMNGV